MYQFTLNIDQEKSYIHTSRILLLYKDTVPPQSTQYRAHNIFIAL